MLVLEHVPPQPCHPEAGTAQCQQIRPQVVQLTVTTKSSGGPRHRWWVQNRSGAPRPCQPDLAHPNSCCFTAALPSAWHSHISSFALQEQCAASAMAAFCHRQRQDSMPILAVWRTPHNNKATFLTSRRRRVATEARLLMPPETPQCPHSKVQSSHPVAASFANHLQPWLCRS